LVEKVYKLLLAIYSWPVAAIKFVVAGCIIKNNLII
jgi:hypothetical protein